MLNKELIKALSKQVPEEHKYFVNGEEHQCFIRKLKGAEIDKIFAEINDKKNTGVGRIVSACLCDQDGKPVATEDDINNLPHDIRKDLLDLVNKVNKLNADAVEEAEKN